MTTQLFTVASRFYIEGRGLVLVPQPEIDETTDFPNDSLTISRPDGSTLIASNFNLEIVSGRAEGVRTSIWVVVLSKRFKPDDVPENSTVWTG